MSHDFPPQDPLAFVQKLWAQTGLPFPAAAPPNTNDLAKKIAELKAVQGWLQANLSLLESSIRMLEMQNAATHAFHSAVPPAQPPADAWLEMMEAYRKSFGQPPSDEKTP
ncbi:MAG TPA: PhaM family polyhydroxyalkanoate granule multifunctional regulatory protein [Burkholderiales bacterium]|nr:PhaM family polyhydroxyalkanoate granule multifunctional regulatory protein [Burkholderiales bacterium]